MTTLRRVALALGIVLVLGGLVVVAVPDLAAGVTPSSVLVGLVGALAFLAGAAGVRARLRADVRRRDLPDPERRTAMAVPGEDADARLNGLATRRSRGRTTDSSLRERIRAATIEVLAREGYTTADAEAALADGTWTDDPRAAAFFTGDGSDLPTWMRVRDALGSDPSIRVQARHAIDALATRSATGGSSIATRNTAPTDDDGGDRAEGLTDREAAS